MTSLGSSVPARPESKRLNRSLRLVCVGRGYSRSSRQHGTHRAQRQQEGLHHPWHDIHPVPLTLFFRMYSETFCSTSRTATEPRFTARLSSSIALLAAERNSLYSIRPSPFSSIITWGSTRPCTGSYRAGGTCRGRYNMGFTYKKHNIQCVQLSSHLEVAHVPLDH